MSLRRTLRRILGVHESAWVNVSLFRIAGESVRQLERAGLVETKREVEELFVRLTAAGRRAAKVPA